MHILPYNKYFCYPTYLWINVWNLTKLIIATVIQFVFSMKFKHPTMSNRRMKLIRLYRARNRVVDGHSNTSRWESKVNRKKGLCRENKRTTGWIYCVQRNLNWLWRRLASSPGVFNRHLQLVTLKSKPLKNYKLNPSSCVCVVFFFYSNRTTYVHIFCKLELSIRFNIYIVPLQTNLQTHYLPIFSAWVS